MFSVIFAETWNEELDEPGTGVCRHLGEHPNYMDALSSAQWHKRHIYKQNHEVGYVVVTNPQHASLRRFPVDAPFRVHFGPAVCMN